VTSRLWRHRVTWRHRWRHHSTTIGHFPIGFQMERIHYLKQFSRYLAWSVMTSWRHYWRHDARIDYLRGSCRHRIKETIMLKDHLIPIRTIGEEAFQRLEHFKCHDVFRMTSYAPVTSSVMWQFDSALAISYTSSIETKPVSRLVYEIFSFKYYITSWSHVT